MKKLIILILVLLFESCIVSQEIKLSKQKAIVSTFEPTKN